MHAIDRITMRSGKRKEPSDSADGKSDSVDEIVEGADGKSESVDEKSEIFEKKGEPPYVNMEETVLGPYSTAEGRHGIDDYGFHLYYTFQQRPELTEQESAFMERYRLYQAHLLNLKKECMEGVNSTEAGIAAEYERKAKIAKTDAGGDAERNLNLIISNALSDYDKRMNAERAAQGLPEKTSKDNSDQEIDVDSDGDCEIVEDKTSVPKHAGQGGAA